MKAVSVKEAVSVSTPLPTKVKFVLGHRCAKWIRINWIVDKLYLNQGRQTHFFSLTGLQHVHSHAASTEK